MASMAAAIHAAKVRASEKNAEKSTEKPAGKNAEKNAVKNGAQKNNADRKNASRSNRRGGGTGRARKQGGNKGNQQGGNKGNQQGGNKGNQQQNRPAPRRYEPFIPEVITYPEELPVSERRDDIMNAIRDNQVVIIAGETGSGKTTQIPKMCLELGLGEKGLIGHTQPRRLAARSVAERIAEELGQKIGETVGYQVRFTSEVGEHSAIKLMTDGILLAEIQNDKLLRRYSTLIIDEAHERSLNIDFILGYLKRILPQRPDLKVIITSATKNAKLPKRSCPTTRRPSSRSPAAPTPSKSATAPSKATSSTWMTRKWPKTATPPRRFSTPSRNSPRKPPATSSSSSPASAKSATPRTPSRRWSPSRRA